MSDPKNATPQSGSTDRMTVMVIGVFFAVVAVAGVGQAIFGGGTAETICSPATASDRALEIAGQYEQSRIALAPTEALGVAFSGQFGSFRNEVGGIVCAIEYLNDAAVGSETPELYKAALASIGEGDVTPAAAIITDVRDSLLAEGEASSKATAIIASHLGSLWFYEDIGKSLEIYKEAVSLDNDNVQAWIWLANILRWNQQYDMAMTVYEQGLVVSEADHNLALTGRLYANIGHLYRQQGDLNRAIDNYTLAGEIAEELGAQGQLADVYGHLGGVFAVTVASGASGTLAIQYLEEANALNTDLGRLAQAATGYGQLAQIHIAANNLQLAVDALLKAVEFSQAAGDMEMAADRNSELGMTYWTLDDADKAVEYLGRSLAINEELGRSLGAAQQHENLGYLSDEQGDLQMTCDHWSAARSLYQDLGSTEPAELYGQLLEELGCS